MEANSRCIDSTDQSNIGCADDVIQPMRDKCDGQAVCEFYVSVELGPLVTACRNALPYLYVHHECVEGEKAFLCRKGFFCLRVRPCLSSFEKSLFQCGFDVTA